VEEYSVASDLILGSFASEASQLETSFEELPKAFVALKREGKSLIDQIEEEIAAGVEIVAEVEIQRSQGKEEGAAETAVVEIAGFAETAGFAENDFEVEIG